MPAGEAGGSAGVGVDAGGGGGASRRLGRRLAARRQGGAVDRAGGVGPWGYEWWELPYNYSVHTV